MVAIEMEGMFRLKVRSQACSYRAAERPQRSQSCMRIDLNMGRSGMRAEIDRGNAQWLIVGNCQ